PVVGSKCSIAHNQFDALHGYIKFFGNNLGKGGPDILAYLYFSGEYRNISFFIDMDPCSKCIFYNGFFIWRKDFQYIGSQYIGKYQEGGKPTAHIFKKTPSAQPHWYSLSIQPVLFGVSGEACIIFRFHGDQVIWWMAWTICG